ncbi:type II toxin-antitoxin system death-on-curing family toxin [Amycolatopsis sp. FDAARGOS 1241]|uniref:type II toxin-antitoxin system death-on-curing family toxin n=1 Tax=Amycolatopsis sp. FDAARGOS 1241 TaxID=2778070 RepID=UPI001EF1B6B1|nr:Fic family protein [Amycolatopsis sp. FDAARGOS 1241]
MTEYLSVHDFVVVARRVARGEFAVRDTAILAAAVARPRTSVLGEDANPGVWGKAAALMESLGRGHPLIDGNKRLAWTAIGSSSASTTGRYGSRSTRTRPSPSSTPTCKGSSIRR